MTDAYSALARHYDRLSADFDHAAWADHLLTRMAALGVRPKTLADCACGTGRLTIEMAKRGIKTTGLDIAPEMLARAGDAARKAGVSPIFVCQDMTKLALPRPVDAITCACDGVNYLTTESAVTTFFRRVFQNLKPGGVFCFDVSTPYKLRTRLADACFFEDFDDLTYLWSNQMDGALLTMRLIFFEKAEDGLYRRRDETHVQRAHEEDELTRWLTEAGFSEISRYGEFRDDAPKPDDLRVQYICR